MRHQTSNAIAMFEQLPARTRRKLDERDMESLTGAVLVKERIYQYAQLEAREKAQVKAYKRRHGYCGGRVTCLEYVGPNRTLCSACAAEQAAYNDEAYARRRAKTQGERGPERRTRVTEYGAMRAEDRRLEREERERGS
jgi:hypothetical protein